MRLCRFGERRVGVVNGGAIQDITDWVRSHAADTREELVLAAMSLVRDGIAPDGPTLDLLDVTLLPPILAPEKILAAPDNYKSHAAEMANDAAASFGRVATGLAEAGLFFKAPSCLLGSGGCIHVQIPERRTDFEVELVAVIGQRARNVSSMHALDHVAGYTLGLDITLRGPEDRSFRKSFDGYSPLGPTLVTAEEVGDPQALDLQLFLNDELRQSANTSDMISSVAELIAYASQHITLVPGDLVFTGTPSGVGQIRSGDRIRAACPALGSLIVDVA